ncbi:arrestin domain protein [Penicillium brasilianum]|uniref:Arrestin domain protein n=1 Tax=Penicillium brasilianum TaxID=104259 RepID=A0A1S9RBR7_PENBI|nr:arrestin domain protein [Penicillium brasilianum]
MMMMAAHISPAQASSRSSSVSQEQSLDLAAPLSLSSLIHTRSARRRTGCLSATVEEQFPKQNFSLGRRGSILRKLAGPRENAKRFLRLRSAGVQPPTPPPQQRLNPRCSGARPVSEIIFSSGHTREFQRSSEEGDMRSDSSSMATDILARALPEHTTVVPELSTPFPPLRNEKIVATGSGLTVGIALTEPVLFLQGYDQHDPSTKKSAILRGQIHLKVTKCVKIKKISICFRGHAQTDWPDGIPPKKIHFHDKKDLFTHGVIYFNHGDTALMQNDYGAHYYQHAKPASPVAGKEAVTLTTRELFSKSGSNTSLGLMTAKDAKRLSVQTTRGHSRSFSRNEPPVSTQHQPQRNYRMFPVGDYLYSFEFPIDGSLPETIKTDLGFVRYDLEAIVERSGAFRPNLLGTLEIPVIRTPAEGSLEQVEPIAISRNWEDQLHYDIVISGKSFPLGSQIPIAFKLTPLAKVECHRIKVYVTENIQHWTADKSVHRLQPAKKVLLFEKRAESASTSTYPGSSMRITAGGGVDWDHRAAAARGEEIVDRARTNLLGNLNTDSGVGPTEMEFNVQLPSCHEMRGRDEAQRLHFDTTYENIQINHWIKIVLRLSKIDERDPTKRRHFEISIDSPFHILSCKATQANIYLPAYSRPATEPDPPAQEFECGCPGAPPAAREYTLGQPSSDREDSTSNLHRPNSITPVSRSFTNGSGGLARPPQAHIAHEPSIDREVPRPMHLVRAPSFAPPAFEDVPPPPPLVTPPPEYTSIVGNNDREAVLEDYFSRLSFYEEQDDERGLGRVDVPLTPGGRVNRSMDVPREWVRIEDFTAS